MLADIENRLCEGFDRELLAAAQKNLTDESNPLRLNNYSYTMYSSGCPYSRLDGPGCCGYSSYTLISNG